MQPGWVRAYMLGQTPQRGSGEQRGVKGVAEAVMGVVRWWGQPLPRRAGQQHGLDGSEGLTGCG